MQGKKDSIHKKGMIHKEKKAVCRSANEIIVKKSFMTIRNADIGYSIISMKNCNFKFYKY